MKPTRLTVTTAERDSELIVFLAARLELSKKKAKALLDARAVFVNNKRVWMARHRLRNGDVVEVQYAPPARGGKPAQILYQDERFLIAEKPSGILSNGPDSFESTLREQLKIPGLVAAHRLDRDTSGCLLFAKNPPAMTEAIDLFRDQEVRKTYHAIAVGRVENQEQVIRKPLDEKDAITAFRVLDANEIASHLQLALVTGRTHQVRKHLAGIGHPVAGDRQYATGAQDIPALRHVPRQMLHARRITFRLPGSGTPVHAESPLPPDFRECLKALRLS